MTDRSPAEVLALVMDGTLTVLDRPSWMDPQQIADLHAANAGCSNAAQRLAPVLASGWGWTVGYDNLAQMVWSQDAAVVVRVISLTPAHALLLACLQVLCMGADGVRARQQA
ncbi:MAG: hypothetical protein V4720_06460 [Pseudomonadota bacterium]